MLDILECLSDWRLVRKVSAEVSQLDLNYIVAKQIKREKAAYFFHRFKNLNLNYAPPL
jgi:hypothetical protein